MHRTKKVVAEAADAAVENAEVKEEVKAPKKAAAKKTKVKEPTVNFTVEYPDNNKTVAELTEFVKEAIKETYAASGNTEAIETIDIYYYPPHTVQINLKDEDTGEMVFFPVDALTGDFVQAKIYLKMNDMWKRVG